MTISTEDRVTKTADHRDSPAAASPTSFIVPSAPKLPASVGADLPAEQANTPTVLSTRTGNARNPGAGIEYELFMDCVHCGLCTASCPTYVELGNENDSPRGRIYLMRAVTDGRLELTRDVQRHLELCLDCRACETACPSGVQYGKLIEPFRVAMEEQSPAGAKSQDWFHKYILFGLFPYPERMRAALGPARLAQALRLDKLLIATRLWKLLPSRLGRLATMLPPLGKERPELPEFLPAKGERRARVALFSGCVADVMFRETNWATARVLQQNGCDVVIPKTQGCCGAIHLHAGSSEPARDFADANVKALGGSDIDAVIVNVAGCGSMLKDYGHHWRDEKQSAREAFAHKVKDVSEFLDDLGLRRPEGELKLTATYHDACHLAHAQKIREAPRRLLSQIPGLTLRELPESDLCCGAAGTYNLTEPEMAERLGHRKLANIESTGAQVVVTANAGCLLQIARQARMEGRFLKIVHPIDLLDLSYRKQPLA
jgi:glycolate oxidase iron-sulfur subunit